MGKPTGFKEFPRKTEAYRDATKRLLDFEEIYTGHDPKQLAIQGSRCMDCGVPFCQSTDGCPIHNLIPEWNDLVYRGHWREALDRLHQTNNFPEFTGRVCPAPCEGACVLGITDPAVTIKNIEMAIIDRGFDEGWVVARPPANPIRQTRRGHRFRSRGAVRRCAAQSGGPPRHRVRARRSHRRFADVRHSEHEARQTRRRPSHRSAARGRRDVRTPRPPSATAATARSTFVRWLRRTTPYCFRPARRCPRDLPIPGRELAGIHFAMDFLRANTKSLLDSSHADGNYISAKDKDVIVVGGGDTGTDCIGTSLRHGCRSLVNFEILPQPPAGRAADNPWPTWPKIFRVDYGHEEASKKFGADPRVYSISGKVVRRQRRSPDGDAHDRSEIRRRSAAGNPEHREGLESRSDPDRDGLPRTGTSRRPTRSASRTTHAAICARTTANTRRACRRYSRPATVVGVSRWWFARSTKDAKQPARSTGH